MGWPRRAAGGCCTLIGVILIFIGAPPEAKPALNYTLGTRAAAKDVQVTLDTRRFGEDGVATIRISNRWDFPIEGDVPACETTFEPKDPRYSPIRPKESGPFVVGPKQTIELTRPFRVMDPTKRRPDGTVPYVLNDDLPIEAGCKN